VFLYSEYKPEGFGFSERTSEAEKVVPVIDRRYPLSNAAEALGYLEERNAQGKTVLIIEDDKDT
jgi:zinc-binding alcohol dehydrogenase family protein